MFFMLYARPLYQNQDFLEIEIKINKHKINDLSNGSFFGSKEKEHSYNFFIKSESSNNIRSKKQVITSCLKLLLCFSNENCPWQSWIKTKINFPIHNVCPTIRKVEIRPHEFNHWRISILNLIEFQWQFKIDSNCIVFTRYIAALV